MRIKHGTWNSQKVVEEKTLEEPVPLQIPEIT